jgi:AGCS family alanine or glycine:cation symporter
MELLELMHQIIWGPWTLAAFLGAGCFFTIKFRFFQVRGFSFWWKHTAGSIGVHNDTSAAFKAHTVTQLQSVCTALAATVGTGNIAGVATALAAGGPGALFWMWVSALIGMITAYAETFLGIKYRFQNSHGFVCGPFVYMERGLKVPWLGMIYAFFCLLCSLGMGSMVQANSAVTTIIYTWRLPGWIAGTGFTFLILLVTLGGIKRIGKVASRLMPAAALLYIIFSLIVIFSRFDRIPWALRTILSHAFCPEAAAGGAAGYAISRSLRYGISRGVFSNEAGLGTLAVLHGPAEGASPHSQGMWAMFEVFFDTIILCTLTALVILCVAGSETAGLSWQGAALTAWCFEKPLGLWGSWLVSGSIVVFAFATIIAWFYLGIQAALYLEGNRKKHFFSRQIYPLLFLASVFLGGNARLDVVWMLSDIFNGLMAFPNLTALLLLHRQVSLPPDWSIKKEHLIQR